MEWLRMVESKEKAERLQKVNTELTKASKH
jgi:hypothetical protein